MRPESRKCLWDAAQAAERAARFAAGKAFQEYQADDLLRSAVERQLEIIGEALAQLRRADPETASAIAELPEVVAFRNILVHGYAALDHQIVWDVLSADLPPLRKTLQRLLESPRSRAIVRSGAASTGACPSVPKPMLRGRDGSRPRVARPARSHPVRRLRGRGGRARRRSGTVAARSPRDDHPSGSV